MSSKYRSKKASNIQKEQRQAITNQPSQEKIAVKVGEFIENQRRISKGGSRSILKSDASDKKLNYGNVLSTRKESQISQPPNEEWVSRMQVLRSKDRHRDIRINRGKKPASLIRKVKAIAQSQYSNSLQPSQKIPGSTGPSLNPAEDSPQFKSSEHQDQRPEEEFKISKVYDISIPKDKAESKKSVVFENTLATAAYF